MQLSIIKKRVALPSKTDVAAVIKSSKRIVGAKHDAAAKVPPGRLPILGWSLDLTLR